MRYFNKWFFILWAILTVLFFSLAPNSFVVMWDGIAFDEEVVVRECNMTVQEFRIAMNTNADVCPEGMATIHGVGGSYIEWDRVIWTFITWSLAYNFLYLCLYLYLLRREGKRWKDIPLLKFLEPGRKELPWTSMFLTPVGTLLAYVIIISRYSLFGHQPRLDPLLFTAKTCGVISIIIGVVVITRKEKRLWMGVIGIIIGLGALIFG